MENDVKALRRRAKGLGAKLYKLTMTAPLTLETYVVAMDRRQAMDHGRYSTNWQVHAPADQCISEAVDEYIGQQELEVEEVMGE